MERKGGKQQQFREILQLNRKSIGHSERKSFIGGSSVQYVDLFCPCRTKNIYKNKIKKEALRQPVSKRTKDRQQLTQSLNALPTQQHKFFNVAPIGHLHNYPLRLREVQGSSICQASVYVILPPRKSSEKWDLECGLRSRPKRSMARLFWDPDPVFYAL